MHSVTFRPDGKRRIGKLTVEEAALRITYTKGLVGGQGEKVVAREQIATTSALRGNVLQLVLSSGEVFEIQGVPKVITAIRRELEL